MFLRWQSIAAMFVLWARFAPAQSAPAAPWVEAAFEFSVLRAGAPYMNTTAPLVHAAVALPIASHAAFAVEGEDWFNTPYDVACVGSRATCPRQDTGFSVTGASASLIADQPYPFPHLSAGVGVGAYRLRGDWGHSPLVLGVPVRLAAPVLPGNVRSLEVTGQALIIPAVDHSWVLSYSVGLAFRGAVGRP